MVNTDPQFWASLLRTFYFATLMVPAAILIALGLALLLNRQVKGIGLFRAAYFLPHLVPIAASAVIWLWILDPRYGIMNKVLAAVGVDGPGWLTSTHWAVPGIALIALWMAAGGNTMIIFLAGLRQIPATDGTFRFMPSGAGEPPGDVALATAGSELPLPPPTSQPMAVSPPPIVVPAPTDPLSP